MGLVLKTFDPKAWISVICHFLRFRAGTTVGWHTTAPTPFSCPTASWLKCSGTLVLCIFHSIIYSIDFPDLYFLNSKFAYLQEVTTPNFMMVGIWPILSLKKLPKQKDCVSGRAGLQVAAHRCHPFVHDGLEAVPL
jgi:amino acid permease